jgi:dermatan/chondrotin sulfate uronyl 2-O-sulfotransferase UST
VTKFGDHRGQVMQFCGHHPICREFNSEVALQIAKNNVEKYYPVVGIVEDTNMTLSVLESVMPEYFEGAKLMYNTDPEIQRFQHRNAYKLPVSQKVLKLVAANFTQEIEFYEFCKQRLKLQFKKIEQQKQ